MKGWYGDKQQHGLASKGIRTKANGVHKNSLNDKYIEKLDEWFGNVAEDYEIAHLWLTDDGFTHRFVIYSEKYETIYAIRMWEDFKGEIAISIDGEHSIGE